MSNQRAPPTIPINHLNFNPKDCEKHSRCNRFDLITRQARQEHFSSGRASISFGLALASVTSTGVRRLFDPAAGSGAELGILAVQ